ncbi:MAG: hypothetical protein ACK40K_06360 [Raineya sp.]
MLCKRKPRNEKYRLLQIKNIIANKNFELAYQRLKYSDYLEEANFKFWWLICQHQLEKISTAETLEAINRLEQSGFKESDLYFWRALLKFELLTDKQSICQDLQLSISLGNWQAEHFMYVCR